jgi:O-antigen/teichoic acid export membrane protein
VVIIDLRNMAKNILRFLGFDRAVSFGILARAWSLIAGPVTIVIIATGFLPEQQGFYYTFSSLLALQTFFDLGLMFVIAQFASHEFVHLSWGVGGHVMGTPVALKRFTDLLCKTVLWFGVAAILMVVILVPAGLIFFGQKGATSFSWRLPWILAVTGTALNLFVMPFFAVILGSGDVVTVNKRELAGAVLSSMLCWLVIGLHGGLYSVFAVSLGTLVIAWGYLLYKRPELVTLAWDGLLGKDRAARKLPGLSWWQEIWPMQWRMAVSSGSAYFMYQLFNPVLFHYHGPVVAGQMGMTMSVANALLAGSFTVMNAKTPQYGKLIAVRDWIGLDSLFSKTLRQTILLVTAGAVVGVTIIYLMQEYSKYGLRFLPPAQAALLFGSVCLQAIYGSLGIYLRAHKQEPLMYASIFASLIQGATTWYFGKRFASEGVTIGYFAVTACFVLPYVILVWWRCRIEWHT